MALPLDWVPDPTSQRNFERIGLELRPPVPQARVYNNANISVNNDTATALTFNSERWDNGNLHSTSTNTGRLTAPISGLYEIGCNVEFADDVDGYRQVFLRVNGSTIIAVERVQAVTVATIPTIIGCGTQYQLTSGDYVEVVVRHTAGAALNVQVSGNYSPEFWMSRLAGYTAQTVEM